jgi:tetratricopeptide (TPR) repeat protein
MISLVGRHFVDDGNVGTIVLHRLSDVEGSAISLNSLQAPAKARHAYEKALLDMQRDKLPAAAKELRKAVDIYPNYAAAWFELGRIQQHDGDMAQARVSFKTAIATDPKYISPYLYLIELEATAEEWTELASTTDLLLKLDATDYPAAYFCSAIANLRLGQLDAAEKSARAGEKLDTAHRYPQLEEVLATVLAMKKDYAGAAGHMRSYLALAPDAKDAPQMKEELAELETYKPVKAGPAHE